jgi:hypothetical protein
MGINKEDGWTKQGRQALKEYSRKELLNESSKASVDAELAVEELAVLVREHKGYLRVGAGTDGMFWARWKWTAGVLAGLYVFARQDSLCAALQEVCGRASEVCEGKRAASLDRPV